MRFIKKLLFLQKGGYANTCEITIRIALAYLLNNPNPTDPTYMAAQLYFCILFNDTTPIKVIDGVTTKNITVKDHFLNTLNLWLTLSSRQISGKAPHTKKEIRDKFYKKLPTTKEKDNIVAFNKLISTNEFNIDIKKLEKFSMLKQFFMLTKLDNLDNKHNIKSKILSLSTNDDINCIETILNDLKILFYEYKDVDAANNYKDVNTELLDALKLLEKKIIEISYGNTYNNEFLKKLREYYLKDKKFPTPDISIYGKIKCTLNKLYYLRAVQKFFNLMEIINYYYQETLFDLELSTSAPKRGTDTNTLFKFKANCGETCFDLDLETSLTGLNTTQILDRIDNIQKQISIFNKCFFKTEIIPNPSLMVTNKQKLEKIFNDINNTLKSVSITPQQIIELKNNAEFHKYNRENIKKIDFIPTSITIGATSLTIDPIINEQINSNIKCIEREFSTIDLENYLCKFKPIDGTLKDETIENIINKRCAIKMILNNSLIGENKDDEEREKIIINKRCIEEEKKYKDDEAKANLSYEGIRNFHGPAIKTIIPKNAPPKVNMLLKKYLKYKNKYLQLKKSNSFNM
jgi:hypothetical protein